MSNQPNRKLAAVANMRGAGVRMAFAFDTKSKPGHVIIHQVQIHSFDMPLDPTFNPINFKMLHGDNDARLDLLSDSFPK